MYGKKVGIFIGIVLAAFLSIGLYFDGPFSVANGKPSIQPEEDWGDYTILSFYLQTYRGRVVVIKHQNGTRMVGTLADANYNCLAVGDVVRVKKVDGVFKLQLPYKNCIVASFGE